MESFLEEFREEEERRSLVETLGENACELRFTLGFNRVLTWPSFSIRLHRPPVKPFFSMTVTSNPAFASRAAVETPPTPAPEKLSVYCLSSSHKQMI